MVMQPSKMKLVLLAWGLVQVWTAITASPVAELGTTATPAGRGVPSGLPMLPGDVFRVQVHVTFNAGPVLIGLCGDTSCSTVNVSGYKKGVMGYSTLRVLVNSPAPWAGDSVTVTEQVGPWLFVKNETIIFQVSLREDGGLLAVSVEGHDDVIATLDPQPGEAELKILSQAGSAVLLDEDQVTDGYPMAVGSQVFVQFCATSTGLVFFGLCGIKSCSYVAVYGLDQDGSLRYGTSVSLLRNQLTGLSDWIEQPEWTNSSFAPGDQLTLEVSRCSEVQMQVRMSGTADAKMINVTLDKERTVFNVFGQGGNVLLRSLGSKTFLCPDPATPAPTAKPTATTLPATTPQPTAATHPAKGDGSASFHWSYVTRCLVSAIGALYLTYF